MRICFANPKWQLERRVSRRETLPADRPDESTVAEQTDRGVAGICGGWPWASVMRGRSGHDPGGEPVPEDASRLAFENGQKLIDERGVIFPDVQAGGQVAFQVAGQLDQFLLVSCPKDKGCGPKGFHPQGGIVEEGRCIGNKELAGGFVAR